MPALLFALGPVLRLYWIHIYKKLAKKILFNVVARLFLALVVHVLLGA